MLPPRGTVDTTVTGEQLAAVMAPTSRAERIRATLGALDTALNPLVEALRPFIDGTANLSRDGRFLLVGNHTQSFAEVLLISHCVHREIGARVRPLAERSMSRARGFQKDLIAGYGGVIGHPDTARELMRHNETVLVFPGGGREITKFRGEEYQLRWDGRAGFARVAIDNGYPIIPVGLVGGDDIYRGLTTRESPLGRLNRQISQKITGRDDTTMPLVRGLGPTLLPRPERMYLRFGRAIDTTPPPDADASEWVDTIRTGTKDALEQILTDLQALRASDPYRHLNPLAWPKATQPEVD